MEKMSSTLTIIKLEGDAVFAFVEDSALLNDGQFMKVLDQTYLAFRQQVEQLIQKATCPCKACREIPGLDLKFMVHHGNFMIQQLAGIKDLLGSDVTLVHRLLKNHVTESTGWNAYALFTSQGLDSIHADKTGLLQQTESYEHLGQVQTYVMDMHPRYESLKAAMSAEFQG